MTRLLASALELLQRIRRFYAEGLAEMLRRMDDWTTRMNDYHDSRRKKSR